MKKIIKNFQNKKILVIGDLMIDEYIFGKVERISPEAPVPVVEAAKTDIKPGGAANVAANLVSLGAEVAMLGVVGDDDRGSILKNLLKSNKVDTSFIIEDFNRPTTVKTRIIAGAQQLLRVDWESKEYLTGSTLKKVIETFLDNFENFDGIIISDYGKGVITEELFKYTEKVKKQDIPITLDPKERNFPIYRNITAMTPNKKETCQAVGIYPETDKDSEEAGKLIIEKFKCNYALITRSEKGMSLIGKDVKYHVPAKAKQVFDVTGAGDTVISVFTLSLTAGATVKEATEIANIAGGIVVGKLGTAVVTPEELLNEIGGD
ncbi:D-glycero-beta-D-manno-heptose-7-phosphate kinase [Desulfurobacterium atlanticum]|uniref:D-beta-D-heptose 7-phosphate kinase / D-beta-D-heptose 1-phosphate adenosyltransferase n=1 Tax=Desulfurobacterium atlanticum TaxID=240169 RepID=A0A238YKN1_9BACT|nr:D-glycero-beta-D-manno-heptose-7-phosphate kinase [Desulfurobacterium atlanticum]SNR70969.1 D-beta-D-heptose 7-phosphate kinase / D-beta-D-heptose 1-phosphate adenosyltransferase [Desulfurobacterium atlanticum]